MSLPWLKSKALLTHIAVWGLFIGFSLYGSIIDSSRAGREVDIVIRALSYLISFLPWVIVTPFFYLYIKRQQSRRQFSILKSGILLMIIWLPISLMFEALSIGIDPRHAEKSLWEIYSNLPFFYYVFVLLLFGVSFGSCVSWFYYEQYNQNQLEASATREENMKLELQLSELRMQSLQTQLEPHFLFNSLNSISSLVRIGEKKIALDAITQLSDLLRYAVDASKHQYVQFENELQFVRDYISLQKLRFENKLHVRFHDQRQNGHQSCPPFLLQIFIENAIKHGLEENGTEMQLSIEIDDDDKVNRSFLNLKITNSISSDAPSDGLGIGIENLKSRLKIAYGDDAYLKLSNLAQSYQVILSIPAQPKE